MDICLRLIFQKIVDIFFFCVVIVVVIQQDECLVLLEVCLKRGWRRMKSEMLSHCYLYYD